MRTIKTTPLARTGKQRTDYIDNLINPPVIGWKGWRGKFENFTIEDCMEMNREAFEQLAEIYRGETLMPLHVVEFDYDITEGSTMNIEMDDSLDMDEKEQIALEEIRDLYPDVHNINITKLSAV